MNKYFKYILLVSLLFMCFGCGKYEETDKVTDYVKIDVEGYGDIVIELYPDIAPITVENFKNLVKDGFYDGLTFHRVSTNFVIQTGDPTGTGAGGSDKAIKGEFDNNGFENKLSHTRGVVSMARRSANVETEETYNSASSQFFIVQFDATYLDGNYASFGKVVKGMAVVDNIASVSVDSNEKPLDDIKIDSIKFVTK